MHRLLLLTMLLLALGGAMGTEAALAQKQDYITRGLLCIHRYEGAWNANTGNGFYGGLQFMLSTWRSVGGRGYPHQASVGEQLYRGRVLYRRSGWAPWPNTARMCGLL